MDVFGKMVLVNSISGRYYEGVKIACLQARFVFRKRLIDLGHPMWALIEGFQLHLFTNELLRRSIHSFNDDFLHLKPLEAELVGVKLL